MTTPPTRLDLNQTGVIIVDHGSRRAASNEMLEQIVARFAEHSDYRIVEPAHMELAEPTIATAFDRCVERGARRIVVMPYFLLPGKHWNEDIPELTREAAQKHPGVEFMVTAPLGMHPSIQNVIEARLGHCIDHAGGEGEACSVCEGTSHCQLREATQQAASAE